MKRLKYLCFFIIILSSCRDKNLDSEFHSNKCRYKASETFYQKGEPDVHNYLDLCFVKSTNQLLTGFKLTYRDEDEKNIMFEEHYINGRLNGYSKTFHENGSLAHLAYYIDGEKHGESKYWFINGRIKYISNYNHGEANGQQFEYYETGKLKSNCNYENGLRKGWQSEYLENGEVLYEVNLNNGNGRISYKMPELDIVVTEEYKDGKLKYPENTDSIIAVDLDLKTVSVISLKNGMRNGLTKIKDVGSNNYYSESNYKNGMLNGSSKHYYNNGQLNTDRSYENGLENGIWNFYYENGKIRKTVNFDYGKLVSIKCWSEDGQEIPCK